MLSQDILNKIKHIEISTRRLLSGSMVGDSRSAVKGSGLEFDQIRDYNLGDDVRFIDWKATARSNKMLVKQYIEERDRTVFLAVDTSASSRFSSNEQLRSDLMAQIASVLALVADYGKDQVGLVLFSDKVEATIPIKRGRSHARAIMEKLFTYKASKTKTDINCALSAIAEHKRKDMMAFLISDFIAEGFEKNLGIVSTMHDVVAIRCLDSNEQLLPNVGFLTIEDSETGEKSIIDARASTLHGINNYLKERREHQDGIFARCAVDCINVSCGKPFIGDLIRFFRRRMRY